FPGFTKYARDYASRRNPDSGMSRFYAIESTPTSSGVKADHRLSVRAVDVQAIAQALLGSSAGSLSGDQAKFVAALAKDLQAHRGSSVIIPGEHQPPAVRSCARDQCPAWQCRQDGHLYR